MCKLHSFKVHSCECCNPAVIFGHPLVEITLEEFDGLVDSASEIRERRRSRNSKTVVEDLDTCMDKVTSSDTCMDKVTSSDTCMDKVTSSDTCVDKVTSSDTCVDKVTSSSIAKVERRRSYKRKLIRDPCDFDYLANLSHEA